MAVYKRTRRGKTTWFYLFYAPGSTRQNRKPIRGYGYATKREAAEAEIARRVEIQREQEQAAAGPAALPKTLGELLSEFFADCEERRRSPKTVERYRELAEYLTPELLTLAVRDVTPLHLSREWTRLAKSGGHHRSSKQPRPLSAKTVRNIAGVVSAAYSRAIRWALCERNPVADSEPPIAQRREGMALTPQQQALLIESAVSTWGMATFLRMEAATGARRGEGLALRWSDIRDGAVHISRSLCQAQDVLTFKSTKSGRVRVVSLPESVLAALEAHKQEQERFRNQFGPDYRADIDLIFCQPDGAPLRPDSVSASVSALFRRLKLPKGASLHTLRHTHGSHLLAAGEELIDVSARLGHSSVRVTAEVYSHALAGRDRRIAEVWERFQAEGERKGRTQ